MKQIRCILLFLSVISCQLANAFPSDTDLPNVIQYGIAKNDNLCIIQTVGTPNPSIALKNIAIKYNKKIVMNGQGDFKQSTICFNKQITIQPLGSVAYDNNVTIVYFKVMPNTPIPSVTTPTETFSKTGAYLGSAINLDGNTVIQNDDDSNKANYEVDDIANISHGSGIFDAFYYENEHELGNIEPFSGKVGDGTISKSQQAELSLSGE